MKQRDDRKHSARCVWCCILTKRHKQNKLASSAWGRTKEWKSGREHEKHHHSQKRAIESLLAEEEGFRQQAYVAARQMTVLLLRTIVWFVLVPGSHASTACGFPAIALSKCDDVDGGSSSAPWLVVERPSRPIFFWRVPCFGRRAAAAERRSACFRVASGCCP